MPTNAELTELYTSRPFSIMYVSRQRHDIHALLRYSTIHCALIIPLQGSARYQLDGRSFEAKRGFVLHGIPGLELSFEVTSSEPYEHINLYYGAGTKLGNSTLDRYMHTVWCIQLSDCDKKLARVEQLLDYDVSLSGRLNQIVAATHLVQELFSQSYELAVPPHIQKARELIESTIDKNLSISEIAASAGMQAHGFSVAFKRAFGVSPKTFMSQLKMERAYELIKSGLLVKDVARAVGFDNPLYFTTAFKKNFGVAPSELLANRSASS